MRDPFSIQDQQIQPGERALIDLTLPKLSSHTFLSMPVHVVHGKKEGPCLFVAAAIHGDELNGVEIVRRLLEARALRRLSGTLIAVPVVNVYGLIHQSRYLPDRRDLNRSFPGSAAGSLAARVAHVFMEEIVRRATHGIDLHTGAIHRTNLPQIRANLDDPETERLARAFGVPVLLSSTLRDGSLREAATGLGIRTLLYEAGEGLRFDEFCIRAGLQGILNVMRSLGMLPAVKRQSRVAAPFVARSSTWTRAPESGLLRTLVPLGARVQRGETLGFISDPSTGAEHAVKAHTRGVVIGRIQIPSVHEGDGLYHIARFSDDHDEVVGEVEAFQQTCLDDSAALDPPIV
ncbi:succinylglutamate desuccinylase/aspartoacylase family protein [Thiorhodococcus minor]|uniref:Succinylglutamate desuccinylase/aspartoacylase family protein n=1 Tax=Thiorhodococcus minor TaxID=57489 RepID=A0A6M0JTT6_9GAMM|nr:succinylglutamate desuccinylase/aspartoacylase family protein [Thiorhodococcus minor]NEV60918.1 succinylglutamate desuccinylase/aspartoacylase family protein [Thiorhodococcus minor]